MKNDERESTSLKLVLERGSLAERTYKYLDGKLLWSAANHCRTAALRHNRETANSFAVTRVVPRIEAFVPFLGMRAFSVFLYLRFSIYCLASSTSSHLSLGSQDMGHKDVAT